MMSSFLSCSFGKSINDEIRCCSAKEATDKTTQVQKADIVAPEVRRHGEELRSDSGNCDEPTKETSIVKHDDPSPRERERPPRTEKVLQQMAAIDANLQALGVSERSVYGDATGHSSFDGFNCRLLVLNRVGIACGGGAVLESVLCISVETRLGHEEELSEEDEGEQRGGDPEDVLVSLNASDVAASKAADERSACEKDGVDSLIVTISNS